MEEYMKGIAGVQMHGFKSNNTPPVRLRREIVPGPYGKVRVTVGGFDSILVRCGDIYTAEELREAAHIFNQIAEAIEDNAK